jgi:hypothetical protein
MKQLLISLLLLAATAAQAGIFMAEELPDPGTDPDGIFMAED